LLIKKGVDRLSCFGVTWFNVLPSVQAFKYWYQCWGSESVSRISVPDPDPYVFRLHGSVKQKYGSEDPDPHSDPYQNVLDTD
jgi:hypothetical protein